MRRKKRGNDFKKIKYDDYDHTKVNMTESDEVTKASLQN